jgi:predicted anti-sigma-YlaC factor YlaD
MMLKSCRHFRQNHAQDQRDLADDAEKPQAFQEAGAVGEVGEGPYNRRLGGPVARSTGSCVEMSYQPSEKL